MSARYEIISELARERGWKRGAELGIFDGRTFLYVLHKVEDLTLIGVDVWDARPDFAEGPTKSGEKCRCGYCNETRAARKALTVAQMRERVLDYAARVGPRAVVHVATTYEAAKLIGDGSLDFVFVDADHSTEGVYRDILDWRPKIRDGGMLLGHDWNMASVRAGVLAHFHPANVVAGPPDDCSGNDHVWAVQC